MIDLCTVTPHFFVSSTRESTETATCDTAALTS